MTGQQAEWSQTETLVAKRAEESLWPNTIDGYVFVDVACLQAELTLSNKKRQKNK